MESLLQRRELHGICQGRDQYFFPDRLLYCTYPDRPLQFGHVLSHAALMDYIFDLVEYLDDLMCIAYVVRGWPAKLHMFQKKYMHCLVSRGFPMCHGRNSLLKRGRA
jgi:hypothetical protein